jgi:hypothetical protein
MIKLASWWLIQELRRPTLGLGDSPWSLGDSHGSFRGLLILEL